MGSSLSFARVCRRPLLFALLLVGAGATAAPAAPGDGGLVIGEPPPPLVVSEWVRGEPVDLAALDGRSVCLVEFWASWCPPCLLEIAEPLPPSSPLRDPDLVRIAVTEEEPRAVRAVLDPFPGELVARVACDEGGATCRAWLDTAGIDTLPHAVLIDREGRVAWHGDPRGELARVLPLVLTGQWDVETARRRYGRNGEPLAGHAADLEARVEAGDVARTPQSASAVAAPVPHDPLGAEEAVQDLEYLRAYLERNYAGYDDIEWKLCCAGSGWAARTRDFALRLRRRAQWPAAALGDVLAEFLAPVQDSHFWMQVPGETRRRFVSGLDPFFTDLRVQRRGDRYVVVASGGGPAPYVGRELVGVAPVDIARAEAGVPYLYPTPTSLPGTEEFLLGRFADGAVEGGLRVTLRTEAGEEATIPLPLHRGRTTWRGAPLPWEETADRRPWSRRDVPDAPWPMLSVRTMVESELRDGLTESAATLRDDPLVILDLRGNGGGSDTPAYEWCGSFSPQTFRNCAGANLTRGVREGRGRWTCWRNSSFSYTDDGVSRPYAGQLVILIDRDVASSGETFVRFASQIPGAVVVGENTMGCVSYGNCSIVEPLPNSAIRVRFGYTKFVENTVMPVREGAGFFPAYWIDEPDVFAGIARLLGE